MLSALDVERSPHAALAHAGWLSHEFGAPLDGLYVSAPLTPWPFARLLYRHPITIASSNGTHTSVTPWNSWAGKSSCRLAQPKAKRGVGESWLLVFCVGFVDEPQLRARSALAKALELFDICKVF